MPNYKWIALYGDGSIVKQYNAEREPKEISVDILNKDNIDTFFINNDNGDVVLAFHLDENQRLIYRRRVSFGAEEAVCHLVGWQMTVGETNIQSIVYCFEDGRLEIAGKFREDHPWFYTPNKHIGD